MASNNDGVSKPETTRSETNNYKEKKHNRSLDSTYSELKKRIWFETQEEIRDKEQDNKET